MMKYLFLTKKSFFSINFRLWLCGHWHYDDTYVTEDKKNTIIFLHKHSRFIERKGNELSVQSSNLPNDKYQAVIDSNDILENEEINKLIEMIGNNFGKEENHV